MTRRERRGQLLLQELPQDEPELQLEPHDEPPPPSLLLQDELEAHDVELSEDALEHDEPESIELEPNTSPSIELDGTESLTTQLPPSP